MQNIKKVKFLDFIKKYRYIILAAAMAIVLCVTLVFYSIYAQNIVIDEVPGEQTTGKPIVFTQPLANLEIITDFSATSFRYNKTLKLWEAHKSIDFKAADGENVFAAFAGKVASIEETHARGTTITIQHEDGLKTVYSSLDSNVKVKVNDNVTAGQVIGTAANTAADFRSNGTMLKFEVLKDGKLVNPYDYLIIGEK